MNTATQEAFLQFLDEVKAFGISVSSVSGTASLDDLFWKIDKLRDAVKNDDTVRETGVGSEH